MLKESDFPGVRALLEQHVANRDIAGAVFAAAVGDAEPVYVCVGETGFDTGRPVTADSIHRLYSQTKPVTGVAIMMLIEEGLIGLDQPLGELLPALADLPVLVSPDSTQTRPAKQQPTIRHLLTHTAGFSYGLQASPLAARYRELGILPGVRDIGRDRGRDFRDMINDLAALPLEQDPGQRFEYSLSIDILGAIVEEVSGLSLDEFFRQRIFEPLGMVDTGYVVPENKLDRLVNLHQREADGRWTLLDGPANTDYVRPARFGGAGLVSTARDYMRFTAMLAGEGETNGVRLLAPDTVRLARSNLFPSGVQVQFYGNVLPDLGFGAAMQVTLAPGRMPQGVFGWGGAAGTGMWVDPIHRLHMVLMTQYMPAEINLSLRESPAIAAYADLGLWPAGNRTRLA